MNRPDVDITRPTLPGDTTVWFSAYGLGRGYRAFAISFDVVHGELGATDTTTKQLLLAVELSKPRILQAIDRKPSSNAGRRILLSGGDFSARA